MATHFGLLVRTHRERDGYSRRELAEAAGLSEGAVRDYELGKRSPTFEAVCRLAVALGVKPNAFAAGADVSGAFRLQPKPSRVPYSIITFGKHKGQRLNELPGDYLRWLLQERPRLLQPGQIEEAERALAERQRNLRAVEPDEARRQKTDDRFAEAKNTRRAAELDPILARAMEERRQRPQPMILDPDIFMAAAAELPHAEPSPAAGADASAKGKRKKRPQ